MAEMGSSLQIDLAVDLIWGASLVHDFAFA
jgi:hypothetical protein